MKAGHLAKDSKRGEAVSEGMVGAAQFAPATVLGGGPQTHQAPPMLRGCELSRRDLGQVQAAHQGFAVERCVVGENPLGAGDRL